MCCFSRPADPTLTRLYGGAIDHPEHGRVHVVGYGNKVVQRSKGPNCMLIHIPSAEPMTKDNFLPPENTKMALDRFHSRLFPPRMTATYHSLLIGSTLRGSGVQYFELGEYDVLLAKSPTDIPSRLGEVPEAKRPEVSESLLSWYEEHFPDWHVALFCFDSKEVNEPGVWYWYHPMEEVIRLPALDSHDGSPPRLNIMVDVQHELYTSWPGMVGGVDVTHPFIYTSPKTATFLPKRITGLKIIDRMTNGDFGIIPHAAGDGIYLNKEAVYRLPPRKLQPSH